MSQIPVEDRLGYDPGWEHALVDMYLGMVEAPADDVLEAARTFLSEHYPRRSLEVIDLLETPTDTLVHDLMALQIWQLRGHNWAQIDASFVGFDPLRFSEILQCRCYHDGWSQTVPAKQWGLFDKGKALTTFEYDSAGVGSSTPPEKLPPINPRTEILDGGKIHYFSEADYGFQGTVADAIRIKQRITEECGFYVGVLPWFALSEVFEQFGRDQIVAAYAVRW